MPHLQALAQLTDQHASVRSEGFQGQQGLILLRREPGLCGQELFAGSQELAKLIAEISQRAVIGGLIVSTFVTLTVLPSIYAILQRKAATKSPSLNPMDPGSTYYDAGLTLQSELNNALSEPRS